MKTSTGIALGGALAAVGVAGVISYRKGIYGLEFGLYDIQLQGNKVGLIIAAYNPSCWAYPVPSLFFNVFDANSNYLGSLRADNMQWINSRGVTLLHTWVLPNYTQLVAIIKSLVLNDGYQLLFLDGLLQVKRLTIRLQIPLQIT